MNFNNFLNIIIPFRKKKLDREFICACINGDLEGVKNVLEKGADVNAKYEDVPAIVSAASFGHSDIVTFLAQNPKTDVNASDAYGTTSLFWALSRGKMSDTVEALIKREDIDISKTPKWMDGSLLHKAVLKKDCLAIRLLSENPRVDMNARDSKGQTALHRAVKENENFEIVKLLILSPKVNINALDSRRQTPLHIASSLGNPQYVNHLLQDEKVTPNIQDIYGNTPLHLATVNAHEEVVKQLINSPKVSVSIRNCLGATAEEMTFSDELRLVLAEKRKKEGAFRSESVSHYPLGRIYFKKQKEKGCRDL